ncbi:hypothetical protein EB796_008403 [Bugula neritina]|uniref:Uncharacterized protein n=1 Tax=Bugula neritina TaxID=10212 RepID=A0A7J7K6R1_BUGNE|nr:hypothetical protein EB796_008403 [Bugula neritina]
MNSTPGQLQKLLKTGLRILYKMSHQMSTTALKVVHSEDYLQHKVPLCHENLKQSVSTGNIKTKRVNLSIQIVKIKIRRNEYADEKYEISAKTMKSNLHN